MKKIKNLITIIIISTVSSIVVVSIIGVKKQNEIIRELTPVSYTKSSKASPLQDLTFAANEALPAVVHVKTQYQVQDTYSSDNPFYNFFFGPSPNYDYRQAPKQKQASGSGVIISQDGYIVTNNHVVEQSDKIEVVLYDNRTFEAKLIGKDVSTDLALLKIEEDDLPYLNYGKSNELKVGEWVLAVGNPFNLTSTVTAGIVSAKSRNININEDRLAIESFIQTDAAVNPGNSGGALVNMEGYLVGINTAIASKTGSYSGYSFAIPSSIVAKVVADLKQFRVVQRAILGIIISPVTSELAQEKGINKIKGVYVNGFSPNSAAASSGVQEGDIILSIDDIEVNSTSELQEQVGLYRPNDKITLFVKRNKKEIKIDVILRNKLGNTEILETESNILNATFTAVPKTIKNKLRISTGIQIKTLGEGRLYDQGIKTGFIITHINKNPIYSENDLEKLLNTNQRSFFIEGLYPNGTYSYAVIK